VKIGNYCVVLLNHTKIGRGIVMERINIKRWSLLFLLVVIITTITACGIKDKKTIISKDISKEVKVVKSEIQRDIELGNKYLQEGKYDEAKKAYEKAIYMDPSNKQNYLQIKAKYLEKGRIDDGFYIIKLAVKNNVDPANMNLILDDIRKKFKITTIEKKLLQNNKFEMPKSMTIIVNNEENQVPIKWDKVEMNTSLIGTYYCNGIAEQYERPVKLTLYVQPKISVKLEPNAKPQTVITYTNSQYNFKLQLPNTWKDKYVVSESIGAVEDGGRNDVIEKSIIFSLKIDEQHVCKIFSIFVYKKPVNKDYIDNHNIINSIYLNTNGDKTFGTMHVTGPEGMLLDGKHDSAYKTMQTMINVDFPTIIKTFKCN